MAIESEISRSPVMMDVARLAGVSHQTVSRVLNAHPNVSSQTREKVERAISELGYRRNTAARSLVTRRSQTVGVLCSDMAQYGPSNTLLGLQQAARDSGYSITMTNLKEITRTAIQDALNYLMGQSVDGIIITVPHTTMLKMLGSIDLPVPLVAVGFEADERLSVAAVDQRRGASLAVQHLMELGHVTIAHVAGPPDWIDAVARVEGWRDTLSRAGLPNSALIMGDWSAESGYQAGLQLATVGDATAIFAANDQMALGAIRAFSEVGLQVPADISVVGYDDQPEAGFFLPPLTTVHQDFQGLGARCMQALLFDMVHGQTGSVSAIQPELVVRSSTTKPRTEVPRISAIPCPPGVPPTV